MDHLSLDVERPEQVAEALRAAADAYLDSEGALKGWQHDLPWPRIARRLYSLADRIEKIAQL